jgi:glycosyltransferase involved in cell wall biosynthesis
LPHGIEILVVDAHSGDATVAFARSAGARVIDRPWTNFVDARSYALAQVTTPWTLMIDADEALDDVLRDAIVAADDAPQGYVVLRTTYFAGKPMRIWSNEPLLRLFRTGSARLDAQPAAGGSAQLHERWSVDGPTAELHGTLLHYSYPDVASYRAKYRRYTDTEAAGMRASAVRAVVESMLVLPRFARLALLKGALLDGPRGLYIAWCSATYPATVAWKAL